MARQFCSITKPQCEVGEQLYREYDIASKIHNQVEWEWGKENAKEEHKRYYQALRAYEQHLPYCQITQKLDKYSPMTEEEIEVLLYHVQQQMREVYYDEQYRSSRGEDQEHSHHLSQHIYYTPCHLCRREEYEEITRVYAAKVQYLQVQSPDGFDSSATIVGLIENAKTKNDIRWVLYNLSPFVRNLFQLYNPDRITLSEEEIAKEIVMLDPLCKDAQWLNEEEFDEKYQALAKGRAAR